MKNICNKCTFRIYWNDDFVLYSCGHKIHTSCLLTGRYSIINPTCILCQNGTIIRQKCLKTEKIIAKNKKLKEALIKNQTLIKKQTYKNDIFIYEQPNKGLTELFECAKLGIGFVFIFMISFGLTILLHTILLQM